MPEEIAVLCESHGRLDEAKELSRELDAPFFLGQPLGQFPFLLAVTEERVELRPNWEGAPGPVWVDFTSGPLDFRRKHGGSQMILKAVGGAGVAVLDLTAGLGRDAFILASLGCRVTAVERSPAVAALARDALERASKAPGLAAVCARLEFIRADASQFLKSNVNAGPWDAVYLDPMFPKKEKNALPKKELQILQAYLGIPEDETEARELLDEAKKISRRVVVKRHLRSPELLPGVAACIKGSSTRFDVYTPHQRFPR